MYIICYRQVFVGIQLNSARFYKGATTTSAALGSGALAGDVKWVSEHSYMALHPPSEGCVLGPLPGNGGEAVYVAWLSKKGDLSLCRNWRGICLLDVTSKILLSVLVARMKVVMKSLTLTPKWAFGKAGLKFSGCSPPSLGSRSGKSKDWKRRRCLSTSSTRLARFRERRFSL